MPAGSDSLKVRVQEMYFSSGVLAFDERKDTNKRKFREGGPKTSRFVFISLLELEVLLDRQQLNL